MDEILKRILDNMPDRYDKSEGQFPHDFSKATAIEFKNKEEDLEKVKEKLNIENLEGEELERFINQRTGITRHPATKATTTVLIQGQEGSSISIGDLVASDTVNFTSLEDVSIDSSGEMLVEVESEVEGSVGNVPAGAIRHFPVTIPGLVSVTNKNPVTNGYDAESDESLLERYYQRIRTPATSGNKYHYMNWAMEVVGVGDARAVPLWNGDNTVKVIIIDSNKQPASVDLIDEVQEYIDPNISGLGEGQAPIGAFCTVESAIGKPINISVNITRDTAFSIEQVQENIENSVIKYLQDIAFKESLVSYAIIGSTILSSEGVLDYEGLLINNATANISVNDDEVAVLGDVVVNE